MSLDPQTLFIVSVTNLLALAILLPLIMGGRLSPAAKAARLSLIVHAGAWIAVILSEQTTSQWANLVLSTLSMGCYSASHWLLYRALSEWLGPRKLRRTLATLAVTMPIGYAIAFDNYAWRVGWANLLIALQLLILAQATLHPASKRHGSWRFALCICFSAMAALTLARGFLGAFHTDLYPSFATPHPINIMSLLVANAAMILSNVSVLVAWREEAELQLRELIAVDPLTTLLNRRGWDERGTHAFSLALRHQQPLSLLSMDIDHFKQINDHYGHEAGDAALRLFGQLLHEQQRTGDIIARIGGEEFCVVLPMAGLDAAQGFERRLRSLLDSQATEKLGFSFSFSTGLACLTPADRSLENLRQRSDQALYQAKNAGRGRLVMHDDHLPGIDRASFSTT
ncbi:GGDEF domain-containing protein [Azonexus sp. IMCC34842]|uniref:GGDEF domain-containing protein n=1 Tax=Azonexus sp. IMCC34842 TaxID=3420950 RepID=UPI003D1096FB